MSQLQVSVIGQLMLLQNATFVDNTTFLDEDVQNAQRAKATEVHIDVDYYDNQVTIANNGAVLEDFQKLFTMADSGWDDETKDNENPFGIGFFSNIVVAGKLEIHSGHKKALFDLGKVMNEKNLDIPEEEVEEYYDGFKLTLMDFDFNKASQKQVKEKAILLGKFVHDLDIYYNGNILEKQNITDTGTNPFALPIEDDSITGWLALDRWFNDDVKVFYKGRMVTKLSGIWYAKGELHINDKVLNLRAPDRKEIMEDDKFYAFKDTVRTYLELIACDAALNGSKDNISNYGNAIEHHAVIKDIAEQMKFTILRPKDEKDEEKLHGILFKGKKVETKADQLFIDESVEQSEPEPEVKHSINIKPEVKKGGYSSGGYSSGSSYAGDGFVSEKEKDREGKDIFYDDRPKFWVAEKNISDFNSQIGRIKKYDLCLIISESAIETKVLKYMEKEGIINHISKLSETFELVTELTNTKLNVKEQRALSLLDMVSRVAGFERNVFSIGDVIAYRVMNVPDLDIQEEHLEDDVTAVYNKDSNKVFVDRDYLDTDMLKRSSNPNLHVTDFQFVVKHLVELFHCMQKVDGKPDKMNLESVLATLATGSMDSEEEEV